MFDVSVHRREVETLDFQGDWDRLAGEQPFSFPRFDELRMVIERFPDDVAVVACRMGGKVTTLACFIRQSTRKRFRAGERHLFSLPVQEVQLFGAAILGVVDAQIVDAMLSAVSEPFKFHVLTLGETSVDSPLYASLNGVQSRFLIAELSRKRSRRWFIRMPAEFDTYMMSLGAKSRQNIRREMRLLETKHACNFQVVLGEDEVEPFLIAAESISRKTYQWNVGQRMVNDEPSRKSLTHRAKRGELRSYLLALDGKPCAFMRGKLVNDTYEFETAGFDPAVGKASPGAVLLMWAVRDLIENSACKVFDFGKGGDDVGYKARFGNESQVCTSLQLGARNNPYTWLLFGLQKSLFLALNTANRLIGNGALRTRVKRALRKYGEK